MCVTPQNLYISYEPLSDETHTSLLRLLQKSPCAPTVIRHSMEEITIYAEIFVVCNFHGFCK